MEMDVSGRSETERRRRDRRIGRSMGDEEDRFWRSLHGERRQCDRRTEGTPSDEAAVTHSRSASDVRRTALKSMLDASEARIAKANRMRRPVLAKGALVRVTRGEFAGREGVVEDADYIESRVLLRFDSAEQPRWVSFGRVGNAHVSD